MQNDQIDDEEKKEFLRQKEKSSQIIRLIAGLYLIYLAYQLGSQVITHTAPNPYIMGGFAVLFLLIGGVLSVLAIRFICRN